jgi:hypothetical protein
MEAVVGCFQYCHSCLELNDAQDNGGGTTESSAFMKAGSSGSNNNNTVSIFITFYLFNAKVGQRRSV